MLTGSFCGRLAPPPRQRRSAQAAVSAGLKAPIRAREEELGSPDRRAAPHRSLPRRGVALAAALHFLSRRLSDRHILKVAGCLEESGRILDNHSASGLAGGIAKAWELYGCPR